MSSANKRLGLIRIFVCVALIASVALVITNWPQILELYYKRSLDSAKDEEAWTVAAKLADLRSSHAIDWYDKQMRDENWDTRIRAAKQLASMASTKSIVRMLALTHPALERKPSKQIGSAVLGRLEGAGFAQLNWNDEDTKSAVRVLNALLAQTGMKVSSSQVGIVFYPPSNPQVADIAANILKTLAEIVAQSDDATRSTLATITQRTDDDLATLQARVVQRLAPRPSALAPLYIMD